MNNSKLWLMTLLALCLATAAWAQPTVDPQQAYEDSIRQIELKRKSELALEYQARLNIVSQYNAQIDAAIANKDLVEHRLNMNANSIAVKPVGAYNRNVYFYYDAAPGATVKKVIVFTIYGKDKDYQEYLFDDEGNLYKVNHMPSMTDPATARAYYYENEKLAMYTKDGGKVFGADEVDGFDENAFQESVNWLNKAAEYTAIFQLMRAIEPKQK